MSGRFEAIGEDAPVCVDGVCALPDAAIEDGTDQGGQPAGSVGD